MLALAAACLAFSTDGLTVGSAVIDITPDVPLPLGGYTERGSKKSIPGGDKLYARTVVFHAGKSKIAVVSVDMLTSPESLYREVKKRIPSDITLFLAATHTHSAPDSQMLNDRMTFAIPGIAKFDPKWLQWYADKIATSVDRSSHDPERTVFCLIQVVEAHADFNVARRRFAFPDQLVTRVEGTWRDSLGPLEGKILTAPQTFFVSYAAHATVFGGKEFQLHGDWPGAAADAFHAPVLQGAIGDVLPKEFDPTPAKSIQQIVNGLSHALERGKKTIIWPPSRDLSSVVVPIELDTVRAHPTMAKTYGAPEAFAESIVKQFAPTSANITAFRIGKLAIVGVPGEPTSSLGRQIRDAGRRIGFRSVLVCSHVNGWMGYILDPADYDRGGYEATLSFYGREQGTKVVEASIKALRDLAAGKR